MYGKRLGVIRVCTMSNHIADIQVFFLRSEATGWMVPPRATGDPVEVPHPNNQGTEAI